MGKKQAWMPPIIINLCFLIRIRQSQRRSGTIIQRNAGSHLWTHDQSWAHDRYFRKFSPSRCLNLNWKRLKILRFLKILSVHDLEILASEIRTFLIQSISKTGGHLSSNLGVVELTIALHYVFDSPRDKSSLMSVISLIPIRS